MLKNESIIEEQGKRKVEEIRLFRKFREMVLEHRQQEHMARNQLKQNVIEMYEDQQVSPYTLLIIWGGFCFFAVLCFCPMPSDQLLALSIGP